MVNKALQSAPRSFKWCARNDARSVTVGDQNENLLLQPNGGPVFVQDLENGRREGTREDFANIIKICQQSDIVNLIGSIGKSRESGNILHRFHGCRYEKRKFCQRLSGDDADSYRRPADGVGLL